MTKLALAIGFLAVFGLVAFVTIHLLVDHFKKQNDKINQESTPKTTQENEQK